MKSYLIITLMSMLAGCWLLTGNRTIVVTSNVKHIEGIITIAPTNSDKSSIANKIWYNPLIENRYLEINISK